MASLRVGTLNQLLFSGALLLLAGVLIFDTANLVAERNAAERTSDIAEAGQTLFGALQGYRTQRGPGRIALVAPAPAAPGILADMNKSEQSAAPAVAKFLAACKTITCLPAADLDAIGTARDAVTAIRPQVEKDLALPLEQRSEGIADRWNKSATTLIDLLEKASNKLSSDIRMVDPTIALLVEIKNAGWEVRNYGGL